MSIFKRTKTDKSTIVVEKVEEKETYKELRERMEMKEYISFDDVRKHLVEMIEENKKLREEVNNLRRASDERSDRYRKAAELAQISADEYKSQLKEAKQKVTKLERELQKSTAELDRMEREKNKAITELEMMRVKETQTNQGVEVPKKTPRVKKTVVAASEEETGEVPTDFEKKGTGKKDE